MRKAIFAALMMAAVCSLGGSRAAATTPLDLSRFQWKNRLLFLFAPDRDHPRFNVLHDALAARRAEAADRDLVIFEVLETGPSRMDASVLDPQAAQSLREKLDAPRGEFTVILVGKDGGVKLKRHDPTQLEEIFALIDAMPMRQREMREKKRNR